MHTVTFLSPETLTKENETIRQYVNHYIIESEDGDYWIRNDKESAEELAAILNKHEKELEEFFKAHPQA